MKIADNSVVELVYELEVDGKIVDTVKEEKPLDYIHGMGMLIPKFETEITGKEAGDTFEFTVTPEEGYGDYNEKYKFDVPKTAFEIDGKVNEDLLQIGRIIPMLNSAGQACNGIVAEIKDEAVTMDFNHPMAGKTLNFKGKILTVREATEKELKEGLHGEFLPMEECCCGGHHGGGCGGHHHHGEGECCGEGHGHKDGECCGHGHGHKDGECCGNGHGHGHKDGECCGNGHGHGHKDGECCGKGEGHGHKDGECKCKNK